MNRQNKEKLAKKLINMAKDITAASPDIILKLSFNSESDAASFLGNTNVQIGRLNRKGNKISGFIEAKDLNEMIKELEYDNLNLKPMILRN